MEIDPISNELKDIKCLEKILISKRILLGKIAIMNGKGKFSETKETIELAGICNVLPRPADSNGLIVVKLKQDLKYRGYVHFVL